MKYKDMIIVGLLGILIGVASGTFINTKTMEEQLERVQEVQHNILEGQLQLAAVIRFVYNPNDNN